MLIVADADDVSIVAGGGSERAAEVEKASSRVMPRSPVGTAPEADGGLKALLSPPLRSDEGGVMRDRGLAPASRLTVTVEG